MHHETANIHIDADRFIAEMNRSARYAELGDEDPTQAYIAAKRTLLRARLTINQLLNEVHGLRNHSHRWNGDDYCAICGADGTVRTATPEVRAAMIKFKRLLDAATPSDKRIPL